MLAYFGRYLLMLKVVISNSNFQRLRGATVARLTPDQKVACSNHVGVKFIFSLFRFLHFTCTITATKHFETSTGFEAVRGDLNRFFKIITFYTGLSFCNYTHYCRYIIQSKDSSKNKSPVPTFSVLDRIRTCGGILIKSIFFLSIFK